MTFPFFAYARRFAILCKLCYNIVNETNVSNIRNVKITKYIKEVAPITAEEKNMNNNNIIKIVENDDEKKAVSRKIDYLFENGTLTEKQHNFINDVSEMYAYVESDGTEMVRSFFESEMEMIPYISDSSSDLMNSLVCILGVLTDRNEYYLQHPLLAKSRDFIELYNELLDKCFIIIYMVDNYLRREKKIQDERVNN